MLRKLPYGYGALLGLGLVCMLTPAHAGPVTTSFAVTAWGGPCGSSGTPCLITDSSQQALPDNPLITGGVSKLGSFTFTGPLDLDVASQPQNDFGHFFAPGVITGYTAGNVATLGDFLSTIMSTGSYGIAGDQPQTTSILELAFSTATGLTGTINHDDGISLFADGDTTSNLIDPLAAPPTAAELTGFSIGPGTYDLYYVEANGAPSVLDMEATANEVPEPASLALLGGGLLGLGAILRRRRKDV